MRLRGTRQRMSKLHRVYVRANLILRNCEYCGRNKKMNFWVPRLRSKVKKIINTCNTCKVFQSQTVCNYTNCRDIHLSNTEWKARRVETTDVDFPRLLNYKLSKNELGKCYVVIFTCATTRAVHLEITKTQNLRNN